MAIDPLGTSAPGFSASANLGQAPESVSASRKEEAGGEVSKPAAFLRIRMLAVVHQVRVLLLGQATQASDVGAAQAPVLQVPEPADSQSPEAVSKRILDFVRNASGGDPALLELLIDAAEEAFKQAEAEWGGKLPDVSYETIEMVRAGLKLMLEEMRAGATGSGAEAPAATVELSSQSTQDEPQLVGYSAQGKPVTA